jgi:PAS domain S-box-containing protein
LAEVEETLRAIRTGEVDAVIADGPKGPQVYTLKSADEPYRRLVEDMSEGAATLTSDGLILYCNRKFSTLVGQSVSRLVGSRLQELVVPADRDLFNEMLLAAPRMALRREVRLSDGAGSSIAVLVSLSSAGLGIEQTVCLIVTDLTEQERNEEVLASGQLARLILNRAAQAMVVIDETATIVIANDEASQLAGHSVLQESFEHAFPLSVRRTHDSSSELEPLRHEELLQAGREGRVLRYWEACLPQENEPDRELLVSVGPLWGAHDVFYGCVVTLIDVTERRDAARVAQEAAASQALTAGLIRGQEEERRRLARDLHDGLSQQLAAISLRIGAMQIHVAPPFHRQLQELEQRMGDVCEEIRRVSHELHPATLDHLGLITSLRGLCAEFSDQTGIKTEFANGELPGPLPADVSTCLYRVAQEALRNIARHTTGSNASVHLSWEDGELCLSITDYGIGFDAEEAKRRGGLGLTSMHERMRLVGGSLDVESEPGRGTVVQARILWHGEKTHGAEA